jgi:LPXTG-motif cell wall-anchored protein
VRRSLLLVPLLLALAAAPAYAGGFVTVGLDSSPAGLPPGQPWQVDITVLAHGRTPVEGMPATVRIRSESGTLKQFPTREVEPGVYRAKVTFPASGVWHYEVVDGYIQQVHTYPPVKVTGDPVLTASAPGEPGGGIATGWLVAAGAALLLALAVLAFDRRRRHPAGATPEPA